MYPWTPEPNKVSDYDNFNPLKEKLVNLLKLFQLCYKQNLLNWKKLAELPIQLVQTLYNLFKVKDS